MRRGDFELGVACISLGVTVGLLTLFLFSDHEKGVGGRASREDVPPLSSSGVKVASRHLPDRDGLAGLIRAQRPTSPDAPLSSSGSDDEFTSAYTWALSTTRQLSEMDEGYMPTAVGLYSLTTEQWSQLEFANLTAAEMAKLDPTGWWSKETPGTLQELIGGFPTEADCELAVRNPAVQQLLETLSTIEARLLRMDLKPDWMRPPHYKHNLRTLRAERDATEAQIMELCDEVTFYKSWSQCHTLYKKWSRGQ
jgi:hypothetical protein